jgi:RimJ/RimL family protein N-acetyltransferase
MDERSDAAGLRTEPWGSGDLALLERLVGDPVMMEHLGGVEDAAKIAERQARYELPGSGCFKIVAESGEGAGWVGYWDRSWRDQRAHEIGWAVLPAFQGCGVAGRAAAEAIALLRVCARSRYLHAFPTVDNAPSNALCARLGFELLEECDFEYPPGDLILVNDWRLDLRAVAPGS